MCAAMDSLLHFDDDLISPLDHLTLPYGAGLINITTTHPDSNNNTTASDFPIPLDEIPVIPKEDKYSLRPRAVRRVTEAVAETVILQKPARIPAAATPSKSHHKQHKPKQKPAPLSKYRRKTANARERNRMREINQAFETLRRVIPQMATAAAPPAPSPPPPPMSTINNEKLTKITTLRLAMKYISSLSATLQRGGSSGGSSDGLFSTGTFSDCSDLECLLLESDGESLPLSDHSLLASPDFPETSISSPVDFGDPESLSPFLQTDFVDHSLESSDFSEFLLT